MLPLILPNVLIILLILSPILISSRVAKFRRNVPTFFDQIGDQFSFKMTYNSVILPTYTKKF